MAEDAATVLDLVGLKCPLPVLKSRRALAGMKAGDRLEIRASDPLAGLDIPHMCAEDGHRLVERGQAGDVLIFVVECGAGPRAAITSADRTNR